MRNHCTASAYVSAALSTSAVDENGLHRVGRRVGRRVGVGVGAGHRPGHRHRARHRVRVGVREGHVVAGVRDRRAVGVRGAGVPVVAQGVEGKRWKICFLLSIDVKIFETETLRKLKCKVMRSMSRN